MSLLMNAKPWRSRSRNSGDTRTPSTPHKTSSPFFTSRSLRQATLGLDRLDVPLVGAHFSSALIGALRDQPEQPDAESAQDYGDATRRGPLRRRRRAGHLARHRREEQPDEAEEHAQEAQAERH